MNWRIILQHIPYHHLEDKANQILEQFTINSPQDMNLRKIAKHFKIPVHFLSENSNAQRFGDKYLIIIDNRLSLPERREKLAEEICHCLLPMGNQLLQSKWEINKQENLALRMAAYLLMPRKFILNLDVPDDESLGFEYYSNYFNVTPNMVRFRFELDYQQWLLYGRKEKNQPRTSTLKVAEARPGYESDL